MSDKPTVHDAWAAVQAEVKAVGKDGRNQQQSYNFRGIDGVMNAVGPALRKHGVFIIPTLVSREASTVEVGQRRTPMGHVVVEVTYTVHGPAGDSLPGGTVPGEAMDSGDKATSKAMSVAYRTFLIQALTLPTHEIDPDAESYERSAPDLTRPVERSTRADAGEWQTPDPLAAVKAEVWKAAQAKGLDAVTLPQHYAETTGGLALADADEASLRSYLEKLEKAA